MSLHSEPAGGRALSGLAAGVFFMLLATFFFPSMDAIAKALTERYSSTQVAWARYAAQCLFVGLYFAPRLRTVARTSRLKLQLLRSSCLLGATFFFFTALAGLDLADATATMFAAPLVVTALAGPLLGEKVGLWRWSAVVVGFGGMLLIVRPGGDSFSLYSLSAVAAACFYGLYQLSTRWITGRESPQTTLFYSAIFGGVILSIAVPFVWTTPDWRDVGLMAAMGVLGTLGQLSFILAFRAAAASLLAPFTYSSLIWSTLYGALFFETFPDGTTFIGVSIVVAAGLVILWRERVRAAA